jgi:hypothetical protein
MVWERQIFQRKKEMNTHTHRKREKKRRREKENFPLAVRPTGKKEEDSRVYLSMFLKGF